MDLSKSSRNIQKLLECPICYEMEGPVFLCKSGHNICEVCMQRVDKCPICMDDFSTIRNYCAESISTIFSNLQIKSNPLIELGTAVNRSWGLFPCVVETCSFHGCVNGIVNHLRNEHPIRYARMLNSTLPKTLEWKISYEKRNKAIYKFFSIKNVGTFVFHVKINQNGCFKGTLLMYASRSVAKKFSYHFKVTNGEKSWSIKTTKTLTCRTPLETVYATALTIPQDELADIDDTESVRLTCTVVLKQQILR